VWSQDPPAGTGSAPVPHARPAPSANLPGAAPADTGYPAPTGFVNDRAGVMDETSRARLEAFLDQVKQKTGVQFAVLTLRSTAPLDPIQYKTEAYQRWFQGNRTSLLLLVALEERKIAFETGYELEGILPDALEARIIRAEMTPRFREGDIAGGITAATLRVSSIIAKDRGVTLEWDGRELRYSSERQGGRDSPLALLVFVVAMILFGLVQHTLGGGGGGFGSGGGGGSGGW
jgi:uncharacterized protein